MEHKRRKEGDPPALRIHQAIARQLGTAILSGEMAPGQSLGGEIEKSEALGVSRTAYREAVRILIAKGLIESRPKAGTHITPRNRWNLLDPEILAWMFMGEPDEGFVRDLFELRGLIEPAAAALAAQRRSDLQVEAMRVALEAMRRHGLSLEAGRAADRQFHKLILEAAHNEALAALGSSIGAAVQWTTRFKQQADPNPRDPLPEHDAVFEAIRAQNAKGASRAMRELLELALSDMALVLNRA